MLTRRITFRIEPSRVVMDVSRLSPRPEDGTFWHYTNTRGELVATREEAEIVILTLDDETECLVNDARGLWTLLRLPRGANSSYEDDLPGSGPYTGA